MKIYVSGRITGERPFECAYKFGYSSNKLRQEGHKVINPYKMLEPMAEVGFEYEDLMQMCFRSIDICDAVYMQRDWHDSPGARREHEYALKLGKKVIYEVAE